ncbi:MAG TPA: glycosyltransferase N-terminal domain-containing protein [Myxococcota bacterium]|nr:glycosyltransferase N-terminal domain-containing protein [Myxococcota bacterium]
MDAFRASAAVVSAVVAGPVAAAVLAARPGWRRGLRERLGVGAPSEPGAVWIHGASVGEILSALRLVDRLIEAGHRVIASTWTVTGRDVLRRVRPDIPCQLAPIDHPWCVDSALARARPAALVLIETELWPCWISAAERQGIPVALISGRVSDRSYPRYRLLGPLARTTLRRLAAIGARTEVDAERFVALGAAPTRLRVIGDLKLDVGAPRAPLAPDLEGALQGPLVVAGSTHPGEERAVLDALTKVEAAGLSAALVLAPRHPERAQAALRVARDAGRRARLRSGPAGAPLLPGEVLVLDTLGELPGLYARAAAAFVGGTLAPIGGHNVLEPVQAGCVAVYGPHTANVRHSVSILEYCGAGLRVSDTESLADTFERLLRDPSASRALGEAGRAALAAHRGSASRGAALVGEVIERARSNGNAACA